MRNVRRDIVVSERHYTRDMQEIITVHLPTTANDHSEVLYLADYVCNYVCKLARLTGTVFWMFGVSFPRMRDFVHQKCFKLG